MFFWEGGETGVLLIHGFTATTAEVRPLARRLHAAGYTVAGPLLPGHGRTPRALNRCRRTAWRDAVEAAYRRLADRCARVVVGGESMGGLLALELTARRPEIAAVLAYAPALGVSAWWKTAFVWALARVVPWREKRRGPVTPADARWQGYTVFPLRAAYELFALQREIPSGLPRITQPLLIIQGAHDAHLDAETPRRLARAVRSEDVEIHLMPRSTHCVILDGEWEAVAALTERFLVHL
jgi:carboxylesterase